MKKHVLLIIAVFLVLQMATAVGSKTESITVTGWVSDKECGALHTKPGGEDCVLKCLRGGAHVGHPEWKPQKMVFVTDEDHRIWVVRNPESLRGFEGKHVTITGQLNAKKKTIQITSASEIKTS